VRFFGSGRVRGREAVQKSEVEQDLSQVRAPNWRCGYCLAMPSRTQLSPHRLSRKFGVGAGECARTQVTVVCDSGDEGPVVPMALGVGTNDHPALKRGASDCRPQAGSGGIGGWPSERKQAGGTSGNAAVEAQAFGASRQCERPNTRKRVGRHGSASIRFVP